MTMLNGLVRFKSMLFGEKKFQGRFGPGASLQVGQLIFDTRIGFAYPQAKS